MEERGATGLKGGAHLGAILSTLLLQVDCLDTFYKK